MPGMNSGSDRLDHALAAAFRTALWHQGLIALALLAVLAAGWVCLRAWPPAAPLLGRLRSALRPAAPAPAAPTEPAGRRLLRIGFGLLWLLDGILGSAPTPTA